MTRRDFTKGLLAAWIVAALALPGGGATLPHIEFYFCNYSPKMQAEPAGGDAAKYDFNDTPQPGAVAGLGYGCLQVHELKSRKTVFAFNHFNSASVPCDVGIGGCRKDHPDWTFARNAGEWKARRLSVWVK